MCRVYCAIISMGLVEIKGLGMITSYDKAVVALFMAAIFFINKWFNTSIVVDPVLVGQVIMVMTPGLVYLFPNKAKIPAGDSAQSGV